MTTTSLTVTTVPAATTPVSTTTISSAMGLALVMQRAKHACSFFTIMQIDNRGSVCSIDSFLLSDTVFFYQPFKGIQ